MSKLNPEWAFMAITTRSNNPGEMKSYYLDVVETGAMKIGCNMHVFENDFLD
jgi:hypothetical protein